MNWNVRTTGNKRVLKFDCKNCSQDPSIARTPECMRNSIRALEENASIDKIVLDGKYVREYADKDLNRLKEYVRALESSHYLVSKSFLPTDCTECREKRRNRTKEIWNELKSDPIRGIAKLEQMKKELEERTQEGADKCKECRKYFLKNGIKPALKKISETSIMEELDFGDGRKGYEKLFKPTTRPSFLRSKLKLKPPKASEIVDAYELDGTKIRIYHSPKKLEYLYFLIPPEYRLQPKKVQILQETKQKLLNRKGSLEPNLARKEIEKESRKLMMESALRKNLEIDERKIRNLSKSLAKFSAGLGIIETILTDPKIQDIYVDAPVGERPVYIQHQEFEECLTNLFLTPEDAQVMSSRFRAISGRPFSEADPALDLNIEGVRVTAIQKPLSPDGLAFAIRRHKSTPWTLPAFVEKGFLTPEAAGLLGLLVDSQASILITGSRGSGKTSLLGALMLELLPKYRIICLEDTSELPIEKLRELGFKAQRLHVKPSISGSRIEMTTEDALRTALRLGESVLIMGEVRGPETKSLYEAMRVGAAGNSVMGTIHGSSTKDVFERVVYDLGIPPSSFKATDVIAVATPTRPKGSIHRTRRLTQISEVNKSWKENPVNEEGFTELATYDSQSEELEIGSALENEESTLLKSIARKWSMEFSEVKENLDVRSRIQRALVKTAKSTGKMELLEAENVVESNLNFHRFLEKALQNDFVDYDRIFSKWKSWLEETSK